VSAARPRGGFVSATISLDDPHGQISHAASISCPSCGHEFEATWPGFTFEPETVIVAPADKVPGRDVA
jgi:hypothetical protein